MTGTIKVNGKNTSAKIGGIVVFTYEGAKEAYKTFARLAQDFEKYGVEGLRTSTGRLAPPRARSDSAN